MISMILNIFYISLKIFRAQKTKTKHLKFKGKTAKAVKIEIAMIFVTTSPSVIYSF